MPRSDTLWLAGICAARLGSSSAFMSYAAVLPLLQAEWGMSATAAGSISSAYQLGYAASLVVLSALADRIGARRIFVSAWTLRGGRERAVASGLCGLSLAEGFFKNRAALLMMTGYTSGPWPRWRLAGSST